MDDGLLISADSLPIATAAPGAWTPPPFSVRAPWWNGDLQTCRNFVIRRLRRNALPDLSSFAEDVLVLPLCDGSGDRLIGVLHRPPPSEPRRPLAVLVHGMAGDDASSYMLLTAGALLERGHAVLRLNLRGAGRSRLLCGQEYHAGRSDDLRAALAGLDPRLTAGGVLMIGYSLGANIVLKLLGEAGRGETLPVTVRAAVSVSAPIDLAEADRRMHDPRNRFYHDRMLARLRRNATLPGARLNPGERRAALSARSIFGFNDTFVAPRNGFAGARDYYERTAALPLLADVQVPTLIVHAADDPWIPAEAYRRFPWAANPNLQPHILPGGGHVGFHMRGDRLPWYDRAMHAFFDALPDV